MALIGSPSVGFCLLEGRPLHNITTTMSHKISQILDQEDGLGDSDEEWAPVGQFMYESSIEGLYNHGTGLAMEGLELALPQALMYALAGNAIGDPFTGVNALRGELEVLPERGKLHRCRANFKAAFGPEDMAQSIASFPRNGLVQAGYQTVTDVGPTNLATLDWNTWSADYIDQETGSAIAFVGLSALDLDGGADILFTVQDSANDIAYLDLIVFTALAAIGGEMKSLAAAVAPNDIERYTQLQYEFRGGAGASRSATFAVGLVRTLT